MAYKGKYKILNPSKYRGDRNNCIFRSTWEFRLMKWCDTNKCVNWWSSEPFAIRYLSPMDNKFHRYFPDFLINISTKNGDKTLLIEVKPENQTKPPPVQKRKTKSYLYKVKTWGVNQAKWKSAKKLCEQKNWEFHIWTEKTLSKHLNIL